MSQVRRFSRIGQNDAMSFIDEVRQEMQSPSIFTPIIVNSAYSYVSRVKMARDHGISDFLVKPFSPLSLYERICTLIVDSRSFVECTYYFGPDRRRRNMNFESDERRMSNMDIVLIDG